MLKSLTSRRRLLAAGAAVLALAACGGEFATSYEPAPAGAAQNWALGSVNVTVPETLSVSESTFLYLPQADIVWQEEPKGDRYAQVGAIVEEGILRGAAGLRGGQRVTFNATVTQFHALTKRARYSSPTNTGVHNIDFMLEVLDANGNVIVPAQLISADVPALVNGAAREAEAQGYMQRDEIVNHIAKTIAGYLGTGADIREDFSVAGR